MFNAKIHKVNFYVVGEYEVKKWKGFQKWLWEKCDVSPLDFAAAPTVTKLAFMYQYFVHCDPSGYFSKNFKNDVDKINAKLLEQIAISCPQDISVLSARKVVDDESEFTFFGKESGADGSQ